MFGRMFGKKEDKALSAGEAIQKLRETEEMLMKKQEYLEKKIEQVSFMKNWYLGQYVSKQTCRLPIFKMKSSLA